MARERLDRSPQREDTPAPRELRREVRGIDGEAEVPLGGGGAGDADDPLQEVLPLLDYRVLLEEPGGFAARRYSRVTTVTGRASSCEQAIALNAETVRYFEDKTASGQNAARARQQQLPDR